ncbi:hypothetical protein POM88_046353 [Heracleum sosnowskyi]|uniref:Uncharacterized protein n=1 Tax=Heracleum sosnowskyi TaxID=360622 RepID=A0AAD8M6V9_9APIA|nr:hypothetical protein POM88_046353 [Heracleum sosnowskyi]
MRSNVIYNLSGVDAEQENYHESKTDESEDDEINNEEKDDSDHSTDNDGENIPTAPGLQLKTSMLAQALGTTASPRGVVHSHRGLFIMAVDGLMEWLSNNSHGVKLPHPVHILTAGALPPPAVLMRTEKLGFVVSHGYGWTEVGGSVARCLWKRDWDCLSGSTDIKKSIWHKAEYLFDQLFMFFY